MERDMYGYELSDCLTKKIELSEGTVYPILRKLKEEGFVKTYISEDSGGPPRKYYSITEEGRKEYASESGDYLRFAEIVIKMLKGEE